MGFLLPFLLTSCLAKRDADELKRGEPHFRPPEVKPHLLNKFGPLLGIAQLLRAQLAIVVAISQVPLEVSGLEVDP